MVQVNKNDEVSQKNQGRCANLISTGLIGHQVVCRCSICSLPRHEESHGYTMTMGEGAIILSLRKQKLNTRSCTEAELVACNDAMTQMLWTRNFLKEQGYKTKTYMKQDNTSTIQLEKNGRASSHKRTRHINIRYFCIKDQIN